MNFRSFCSLTLILCLSSAHSHNYYGWGPSSHFSESSGWIEGDGGYSTHSEYSGPVSHSGASHSYVSSNPHSSYVSSNPHSSFVSSNPSSFVSFKPTSFVSSNPSSFVSSKPTSIVSSNPSSFVSSNPTSFVSSTRSSSQQSAVNSLRSRLSDLPSLRSRTEVVTRFTDAHLNRWIKYYNNDLLMAEQRFRTCESWLIANNFLDLLNWEPSEEIKSALPFEIIGKTKDGIPVVDFPFGKWDIRKIATARIGGATDVMRRFAQIFAKISEYELESGNNAVGRTYFIGDMNGYNFRQLSSLRAVAAIVRMSLYFNRCQPLGFQHFYGTRAPIAFRIIWNGLIKRVLSAKQTETISIISRFQNWRRPLYEAVPQHLIPDYLGGTHVPNYKRY